MAVQTIDPVMLSIIDNHLVNICREMGIAMIRTSYSTIFNEGLDFSCVVFDRDGDMMAQAEFCPAMLGAINFTVKWTIEELGLEAFEPGDVVIHNDPYRGGCHMPEHMVLKPVFVEDELFGFVANIGHVADIGGMAPGSFAANATEVYQEGLRLPPVKIMQRGKPVEDIWRIIMANHRTPRNSRGDFNAMIGSLNIAERRLLQLMDKYGKETLRAASKQLMDHSERWMRAEIARIPGGEYYFEDCMDNDGITDRPFWIRLKLTVKSDEIIADYSDSDPQARGPINATYGVTASATYNAMFHLTDKNIPRNAGCYRPIKIITRPGTVVHVVHPGPSVAGNTETHPRIVDVVIGALAPAIPDRVAGAHGATGANFLFGGVHPDTGEFYTNYHFEGVGWGARSFADGNNVVNIANGNCRNNPVEIFDHRYPFRNLSYRMIPDSGGPGKFRGGLGTERIVEVLAPEIVVSALFDRSKFPPWGVFGGKPGGTSEIAIKKAGDTEFRSFSEACGVPIATKFSNVIVSTGDQVRLRTPGGGGYGDPLERDVERVLRDVEEGYVSLERARTDYGVVIVETANGYQVALDETSRLRAELCMTPVRRAATG